MSAGIKLSIISGAMPGGALYYDIGCTGSYPVDSQICLNGVGPHRITFCKPGNNANEYQITAIPRPSLTGKLTINEACIGHMEISGLIESSITWQSVPNNATYNAYLNCSTGCDSVTITPSGNYPPSVNYRVCGLIDGACAGSTFCDTATIRFITNTDVNILPKNGTICFGGIPATLTANPIGGLAPYSYSWNTGATTQSIQVTTPGTYFVTMLDSIQCITARDTVTVTSFTSPILADAGNDTSICTARNFVLLRGSVQAVTTGVWIGGSGTFSPDSTNLHATYYPSVAETNAGVAYLKLVTTGNGTCPADTNALQITISPSLTPSIGGNTDVCEFKDYTYSTALNVNSTYQWNISGGSIIGSSTESSVNVLWLASGLGTLTVTETNDSDCDSTAEITVNIAPKPNPVIFSSDSACSNKIVTYYTNSNSGNTYQWSVSGGSILGNTEDTIIEVMWGTSGSGSVTISQMNTFGCDTSVTLDLTIYSTPVPTLIGDSIVCAYKHYSYTTSAAPGNQIQWNATGGTIVGSSTSAMIEVKWGASGAGSVSVTHTNSNNCDSTFSLNVTINPSTAPVITGSLTACEYQLYAYSTNPVAGNTYQWTVTGGSIVGSPSGSTVNIRWGANGTGNIHIKQTNAFACDSIVSAMVTINPTPVPTITGTTTVCEYKHYTYTTNASAGNTYLWNVVGGTIVGSNSTASVEVKWNANGAGSISVTQTNAFSCDSTVSTSITITPTPAPTI
ncbi:MAG: hypothetical protein WC760_10365, partial [Bacteroidia bacterium]